MLLQIPQWNFTFTDQLRQKNVWFPTWTTSNKILNCIIWTKRHSIGECLFYCQNVYLCMVCMNICILPGGYPTPSAALTCTLFWSSDFRICVWKLAKCHKSRKLLYNTRLYFYPPFPTPKLAHNAFYSLHLSPERPHFSHSLTLQIQLPTPLNPFKFLFKIDILGIIPIFIIYAALYNYKIHIFCTFLNITIFVILKNYFTFFDKIFKNMCDCSLFTFVYIVETSNYKQFFRSHCYPHSNSFILIGTDFQKNMG